MICRAFAMTLPTAFVLLAFAGAVHGEPAFPNKPMRFIVGNAPGGSTSYIARLVGDAVTKTWGHQVVVDNRGGGDGVIAAEALYKAAPDGHTMLLVSAALTIRPHLHPNKVYAAFLNEFVPVATLVSSDYILVANVSLPVNNLQEVIALAKTRPGYLKAAVSNIGGTNHLALELFNVLAGVKIKAIPYKGGGPGMTALISGEVSVAVNNAITLTPHIKSGKIKPIATGGTERLPTLPHVPTFAELGLPGYAARNWFGVALPPRTPAKIAEKLAKELVRIRNTPEFKEKIASQGVQPFSLGPEEFRAFLKSESARFAKIIKEANIVAGP